MGGSIDVRVSACALTYLAFGIVMAVCLWYVDGSLKNDAD
jgi:hypothetical protein